MTRVVLITGATSGIGAAAAKAFAATGARVVLMGRDEVRGTATRDALRADGHEAELVLGDVADPKLCDAAVAATLARFGRLDVLVNNAGMNAGGSVPDTSDENWFRVIDTNLSGVFFMSRAAVPVMRRQGGGVILNVASDWALFAGADAAAYCASKGGVLMLTKAMALDHAREGIRVNAVCPAEIDTPMLVASAARHGVDLAAAREHWAEALPLGRIGKPEEVAAALVYLASDAAAFITGVGLPVDGGSTAR
ncbi:MAG: glucose 1-dehydrogenase [Alphaproteobacteria bacterium]|nr:glucose 1-dehydrogenase [Alphaproteobacteria bacterium]